MEDFCLRTQTGAVSYSSDPLVRSRGADGTIESDIQLCCVKVIGPVRRLVRTCCSSLGMQNPAQSCMTNLPVRHELAVSPGALFIESSKALLAHVSGIHPIQPGLHSDRNTAYSRLFTAAFQDTFYHEGRRCALQKKGETILLLAGKVLTL